MSYIQLKNTWCNWVVSFSPPSQQQYASNPRETWRGKNSYTQLLWIHISLNTYIFLHNCSILLLCHLEELVLIFLSTKIFVPQTILRSVIYLYLIYINHPGGGRLANTIQQLCYLKVLVMQEEVSVKPCKTCKQVKHSKVCYEHLPPNIIFRTKTMELGVYRFDRSI